MTKVLVVVAHPDDEVLGCGGAIAKHVSNGDQVFVIFMADGVSSRDGHTPGNELDTRKKAACNSCKILGTETPVFLDFPDNQMDTVSLLSIVKKLEDEIKSIQPNVVYTHHSGDLNIDHRITHQAVMTACRPLPGQTVRKICSFEVLSSTEWMSVSSNNAFLPTYYIDISSTFDKKIQALQEYGSELSKFPHSRSIDAVVALSKYRGASSGVEAAEAFFIEREISI